MEWKPALQRLMHYVVGHKSNEQDPDEIQQEGQTGRSADRRQFRLSKYGTSSTGPRLPKTGNSQDRQRPQPRSGLRSLTIPEISRLTKDRSNRS